MKKYLIPLFIILCLIAYIIGYTTTTTTTNLGLTIPASGDVTVDWFNTVNANFELVDDIFDDVSLTEFSYLDGVTSSIQDQLNAGGGYTNLTSFVDQTAWRLFYSNTSGDVTELALGADGTYLKSNGASAAPTFGTPSGTDKTNWIYPQDYATGTGTAIDLWAGDCIEDAITAASAGDTIYLRAGYYLLSDYVEITKSLNIIGEGMQKTFIITAGGTVSAGLYSNGVDYITLKNFTIDGDAQTLNTEYQAVIGINSADYTVLENLEVINGGYYGIDFYQNNYSLCKNIYIQGNYDDGFHPGSDTAGRNKYNSYRDIYGWENGEDGFGDRGCSVDYRTKFYNVYDNINCWDNGKYGITMCGMQGGVMTNCFVSGNGSEAGHCGIYMQGLTDFNITNCSFTDNYTGIVIYDGKDMFFNNCQSYDTREVTGIDIAFVDGGAGQDTITMTAAKFLEMGFEAGNDITVSGSTSNNGTYTIISVVAGTINVATASLTAEIAGDIVTITQYLQLYGVELKLENETANTGITFLNCKFSPNVTGEINNPESEVLQFVLPNTISGLTEVTSADADYMLVWDATDSLLKKVDMAEVRGGAGLSEDEVEAFIFDADAESVSGVWEWQDDIDLVFGNDANWAVNYDESVDDQLLFITAGTTAGAVTDPLFEIIVGATPTADQQVFGVSKGTQSSNTALFTLDEDGDALIAGTLGVTGQISGNLTGNVTGNASGTALTVTQAAQASITSLGTLTTLTIDNITINGNDISSIAGTDLTISPLAGQDVVIDGHWEFDGAALGCLTDNNTVITAYAGKNLTLESVTIDAGVVAGITSLTADNIVNNTGILPDANDGAYLGAAGTAFSDVFLAEGGVINWDSGDVTLTQTGDTLNLAGGEFDANANTIGFTLQSATGDGTTTIDWKLGNKFKFTFGAFNEVFTFTAPTNPCTVMLTLIQDATGSRTATWPATVKWPGGVAPTLTTTANARDKIALDWDGTQYDGCVSLDFK